MDIDILYLAECPHVNAARLRVAEALEALGLTARIRETEVSSAVDAVRLGMNGSPTVLVNGRDLFEGSAPSVACRLYRNGTRVDGAPSVEALVELLTVDGPDPGTGARL